MTKCAILLFYATIAGCFYGLLAESPGSQTKLENIEEPNFSKFEPIGSSFYYIESKIIVNWYGANDTCARLGGHLANFPNREELSLIKQKLPEGIEAMSYWLNQPHSNRRYASILKWENSPLNGWIGYETEAHMIFSKLHFICEAEI